MEELIEKYVVNKVEGHLLGIKLDNCPDKGRVVVTTKAFNLGETLLQEKPCLVWNSNAGPLNYLEEYLKAEKDVKSVVMNMYTPENSSLSMKNSKQIAQQFLGKFKTLNLEQLTKLIGVANINAHSYLSEQSSIGLTEASAETISNNSQSALFAFGSKVAHSCNPNVTFTTQNNNGCLEYNVVKPIEKGDVVYFSYIDATPSNPTHLRRQQLLEEKSFFCTCERCVGFDYSRIHHCPVKECKGLVSCIQTNEADKLKWSCLTCGPLSDEIVDTLLKKEAKIESKLQLMLRDLNNQATASNISTTDALKLYKEASKSLSMTHFLTLKCLAQASKISASHAYFIGQLVEKGQLKVDTNTPYGSYKDIRLSSATTNLQYIHFCECIHSKHFENIEKLENNNLPPVFQCTQDILFAYRDLKEIPFRWWPKGVAALLYKYLPMSYTHWGKNNREIMEMEADTQRTMKEQDMNHEKDLQTVSTEKHKNAKVNKYSAKNKKKKKKKK